MHPAFVLFWATHLLFAFLVPLLLGLMTFRSGPRARIWFLAGLGYAFYLLLLVVFPPAGFSFVRVLEIGMMWAYLGCLLGLLLAELGRPALIRQVAAAALVLIFLECYLSYANHHLAEQAVQAAGVILADLSIALAAARLAKRVPSNSFLLISISGVMVSAVNVLKLHELLFGSGVFSLPDLTWKSSAFIVAHLTAIVFLNIGYAGFVLEQSTRREAGAREGQRAAEDAQRQIARLLEERDQMVMMNSQFATLSGMSVLAASIIHEITHPIQALVLAAHATSRLAGDNPALREAVGIVNQQAAECNSIIQSLRKIMNRGKAETELCCLATVLREIVPVLASECRRRGIGFEADEPDQKLFGKINPVLFRRIVFNLATNALEVLAEESGGEGRLRISLYREGKSAILDVTDNAAQTFGVEDLNFEALAGSRKQTGVGLGLMLCARIAESWGGKLKARRDEAVAGGQTVFSILVPLSEA